MILLNREGSEFVVEPVHDSYEVDGYSPRNMDAEIVDVVKVWPRDRIAVAAPSFWLELVHDFAPEPAPEPPGVTLRVPMPEPSDVDVLDYFADEWMQSIAGSHMPPEPEGRRCDCAAWNASECLCGAFYDGDPHDHDRAAPADAVGIALSAADFEKLRADDRWQPPYTADRINADAARAEPVLAKIMQAFAERVARDREELAAMLLAAGYTPDKWVIVEQISNDGHALRHRCWPEPL